MSDRKTYDPDGLEDWLIYREEEDGECVSRALFLTRDKKTHLDLFEGVPILEADLRQVGANTAKGVMEMIAGYYRCTECREHQEMEDCKICGFWQCGCCKHCEKKECECLPPAGAV